MVCGSIRAVLANADNNDDNEGRKKVKVKSVRQSYSVQALKACRATSNYISSAGLLATSATNQPSQFSPQAYVFCKQSDFDTCKNPVFLVQFLPLCREKFEGSSFRTEFKLIKDSKINFISYLFFALDQNLSLLWKAVVKGCDKIGPFAKTPRACHCPGPPTVGSCIASSVYLRSFLACWRPFTQGGYCPVAWPPHVPSLLSTRLDQH